MTASLPAASSPTVPAFLTVDKLAPRLNNLFCKFFDLRFTLVLNQEARFISEKIISLLHEKGFFERTDMWTQRFSKNYELPWSWFLISQHLDKPFPRLSLEIILIPPTSAGILEGTYKKIKRTIKVWLQLPATDLSKLESVAISCSKIVIIRSKERAAAEKIFYSLANFQSCLRALKSSDKSLANLAAECEPIFFSVKKKSRSSSSPWILDTIIKIAQQNGISIPSDLQEKKIFRML